MATADITAIVAALRAGITVGEAVALITPLDHGEIRRVCRRLGLRSPDGRALSSCPLNHLRRMIIDHLAQ